MWVFFMNKRFSDWAYMYLFGNYIFHIGFVVLFGGENS